MAALSAGTVFFHAGAMHLYDDRLQEAIRCSSFYRLSPDYRSVWYGVGRLAGREAGWQQWMRGDLLCGAEKEAHPVHPSGYKECHSAYIPNALKAKRSVSENFFKLSNADSNLSIRVHSAWLHRIIKVVATKSIGRSRRSATLQTIRMIRSRENIIISCQRFCYARWQYGQKEHLNQEKGPLKHKNYENTTKK